MDANELVALWEQGRSLETVGRTLLLLAAALGASSDETVRWLTLGRKEAELLALQAALFGDNVECAAHCPTCAELLEFSFSVDELIQNASISPSDTTELALEDVIVTVRPLTVDDLLVADGDGDTLFARAVVSARQGQAEIDVELLSADAVAAIADKVLALDPLMQLSFDLVCPACEASWSAPFEPATFLWEEIERWGQKMLQTVHLLAANYGWSESAILAMSAWRRQKYLEYLQA